MLRPHQEEVLHQHIVDRLVHAGWQEGTSAQYDRVRGLYTEDVIAWIEGTAPKKQLQELKRAEPERWKDILIDSLTTTLESKRGGTLEALRNGFSTLSHGDFAMSVRPPRSEHSQSAVYLFNQTRWRVVKELVYSANDGKHARGRIDIVLFINGIPVATCELKSVYTQSIEHGIRQYKRDRNPGLSSRKEPLLRFRRGALVHFVVAQDDVRMTTRLAGEDTFFLPFNRGKQGGAGNDLHPTSLYPAAHLWEDVLQPNTLATIVHELLLFEGKAGARDEKLIFPRYHQLDVVRKLIASSAHAGPGQRYLIQHSAGSGKSKSIIWTALGLTTLRVAEGANLTPMFDSVVIVTDRTVLDKQLQDELRRSGMDSAYYENIERSSGSKSSALARALLDRKRVIIVTIQTFSYVQNILNQERSLRDRNFAVIIDEAHSSSSGSTALDLRLALTGVRDEAFQALNASERLRVMQEGRGLPPNISFYAFTATPKSQTVSLFGSLPPVDSQTLDPDHVPIPRAFHTYTMKQAIEEGFILDVLRNYRSVESITKIDLQDPSYDRVVRGKAARRELRKWVDLHEDNIHGKLERVLAHFKANVLDRNLLQGEAKAMICTSSRAAAVAWHLAFQRMREEPRYQHLRSIVAFSEKVSNHDVGDPNFAPDHEFTETNLTPELQRYSLPELFDKDPSIQFLIVANKYQTGFDQPKLVAMYVDKALSGVEAVQTLSRLNRVRAGKEETFVIDFKNDPEEILRAFQIYYEEAELSDAQDPEIIMQLRDELYDVGLFDSKDVNDFVASLNADGAPTEESLARYIDPINERYTEELQDVLTELRRLEEQLQFAERQKNKALASRVQAELDEVEQEYRTLNDLRANLQAYARAYTFITQVVELGNASLEGFYIFVKTLALRLTASPQEKLKLDGLQLTYMRHVGGDANVLDGVRSTEEPRMLRPLSGTFGGSAKEEKSLLSELLEKLAQELDIPVENVEPALRLMANTLETKERVRAQLPRYSHEQILQGSFPKDLEKVVGKRYSDMSQLADKFFGDDGVRSLVEQAVLVMIDEEERARARHAP